MTVFKKAKQKNSAENDVWENFIQIPSCTAISFSPVPTMYSTANTVVNSLPHLQPSLNMFCTCNLHKSTLSQCCWGIDDLHRQHLYMSHCIKEWQFLLKNCLFIHCSVKEFRMSVKISHFIIWSLAQCPEFTFVASFF